MWTTDHTCGRREAVDEHGEQPEGRPNRPVMKIGSKRPRAWPKRQRGRNGKKGMGARENQKRRKQHPAHCLPLRKRNNPNNSSSSSNRSSTLAVTRAVATVMVDNEVLYDICHCKVDDGSAFDRNRRIYDIFGDCSNTSMTNMYAADPSGDAIQVDGPWASCPSSGSGDAESERLDQGTCSSYTPTSSCSSKLDSLCSSVKLRDDTCTDFSHPRRHQLESATGVRIWWVSSAPV